MQIPMSKNHPSLCIQLVDVVLCRGDVDILDAIGAGIHERLRENLLWSDAVEVAWQRSPEDLHETVAADNSRIEVVISFVAGSGCVASPYDTVSCQLPVLVDVYASSHLSVTPKPMAN